MASRAKKKAVDQDAPRRAIGYIRVSSVGGRSGPEYHTEDIQRASIEHVCRARGYELVDVLTDRDQSGKSRRRPQFQEAMERVLGGQAEAIAVWKVSRFSRNWTEAAADTELLLENDKDLLSEEGFDTATAGGRLLMNVLFALAKWEHDVLGEHWESIKAIAVRERGSWLYPAPIGYKKPPKKQGGALLIDPETAPTVAEIFERRSLGAPLPELIDFLDDRHPRPGGGRRDHKDLRRIIENRTYLGAAHWGEEVNEAAHAALVTREVFDKANAVVVDDGGTGPHAPTERAWPLSGWLRCSGCGGTMGGSIDTPRGRAAPNYKCSRRRNGCPAPMAVSAVAAERWAMVQAELLMSGRTASLLADPDDTRLTDALDELDFAEKELVKLRSFKERRALGDQWLPTVAALTAEKDEIEARVRRLRLATGSVADATPWDEMSDAQKFAQLRRGAVGALVDPPARRGARPADRLSFIVEDEPSAVA